MYLSCSGKNSYANISVHRNNIFLVENLRDLFVCEIPRTGRSGPNQRKLDAFLRRCRLCGGFQAARNRDGRALGQRGSAGEDDDAILYEAVEFHG